MLFASQIQTQSTVSSYALPPQTYLAAPPCSIYCKRTKPQQPQRRTYLAVRDAAASSKARLVTFTEELGKPNTEEREPRAPARRERKLRHRDVAGLEVVQLGKDRENDASKSGVLVFYQGGDIDCVNGDLAGVRWEHTSKEADVEVEHSAVVDFDTARKGLLKNREDVLGLLDPSTAGASHSAPLILCQTLRIGTTRRVRIYAMRNVAGETLQGSRAPLEEILSFELASRSQASEERAHYELHAASGMLYQRLRQRLTAYDLSATTPKISFELGKKGQQSITNFIRLSAASVVAISQDRIAVYDTKFGSVLGSLTLTKRDLPLDIIANFTDPGLCIALQRSKLVAIQLGELGDAKHAKSSGPLLAEVLGKGKASADSSAIDVDFKSAKKQAKWDLWKAKLDGFVDAGDIEGLEDFIASDIIKVDKAVGDSHIAALANGSSTGTYELWDLPPHAYDPQHLDAKRCNYILAQTFGWDEDTMGRQLRLRINSRNILRWFAMCGYLTSEHILHTLPESNNINEDHVLAPGDIMRAINDVDTNFILMCELISLDAHWEIAEVAQALKILMESFEERDSDIIAQKQINGTSDITMTNAADEEAQFQAELKAAEAQRDVAEEMLTTGVAIRSEAFRILLARLSGFPQKEMSKTMQALWSQEDILFFIAILRLELIDGGWTKLYIDPEDDAVSYFRGAVDQPQEITPRNEAIRIIATLFSCAIDAIGLSGWLIGLSGDAERTYDLVTSLRIELSAVLEGLFVDAQLDSCITELSRTAGSAEPNLLLGKRKRQEELQAVMAPEKVPMPLGGRYEPPVLGNVKEKKSRAAVAEKKSRSVGKYSFEQIRF